jgi:WD40 repeat protein
MKSSPKERHFFSQSSANMQRTTQKRKTFLWAFLILLVALIIFALYYSVWKKPALVTHNHIKAEKVFKEHTAPLWAVQFSPNGMLVASGSVDSTVRIWQKETGQVVQILRQPLGVTSLQFSTDGGKLVTGSYDGLVRIWDWKTSKTVKELKGHSGTVWSVVYSPDGKILASCGEDRTVKLWNAETGTLLRTIPAHLLNIWKVRFTPDGKKIISSSFDNTIKIWNVADGSLLKTLQGHSEAVVGLAVSPDGGLLASGSDDKTIKLWDIDSGKLLRSMENGDGHVYAVAFSPDGKRLISGSRDKDNLGEIFQNFFGDSEGSKGISMRLWDVQSGALLETLAEHANDVMDVCYSADGKWIASASDDKTVRLWKITTTD